MSMPPLPTMHRIEWSVMIPGASSSGHLTVVGDPALPSTIAEVTDYARRRLVDGDSLDEVIVEIFDPDTSRTLFHGRVGPEPITMQVDRRLLALFPLDDGSTLQVLGTASDGYRLARCPAGEDSDPDGARYFGELGTAVAAAVELAGIEIPHPNPGGTNPMNDRDPFGRDDHLGDPSLPDGPAPACRPSVYGLEIPSTHRPRRSCIGSIERTGAGNIAMRIGRETAPHAPSWQQSEHVVLSPSEARAMVADVAARLQSDRIPVAVDGFRDYATPEGWALWLEGWCDHPDGESDGPACCVWRQAAAAMRARAATLEPAEHAAFTVAQAQASRGEAITPNVGAVLVMTLERMTGKADA